MKDISGILSIADKIWFNDEVRCRFRICGFTKKQIKKLETSKYIDITLLPSSELDGKFYINISEEK